MQRDHQCSEYGYRGERCPELLHQSSRRSPCQLRCHAHVLAVSLTGTDETAMACGYTGDEAAFGVGLVGGPPGWSYYFIAIYYGGG